MRQEHRAGEKMFVDYAGQSVAVVDRETGQERQAQVGLPRFGGRLRAVTTGTGVNDSRWNEVSLGDRC